MTSQPPPRLALVALSDELELAHEAYIKSLRAAKLVVQNAGSVEEFVRLVQNRPSLLVVGADTGLPNVDGPSLLQQLDRLELEVAAPVLFLNGPTGEATRPEVQHLRILNRWSEARESLGLEPSPRGSKPPPEIKVTRQAPIKLVSKERTLEMIPPPASRMSPAPLDPVQTIEDLVPAGDLLSEEETAAHTALPSPALGPPTPTSSEPASSEPFPVQAQVDESLRSNPPTVKVKSSAPENADRTEEMLAPPEFADRRRLTNEAVPPRTRELRRVGTIGVTVLVGVVCLVVGATLAMTVRESLWQEPARAGRAVTEGQTERVVSVPVRGSTSAAQSAAAVPVAPPADQPHQGAETASSPETTVDAADGGPLPADLEFAAGGLPGEMVLPLSFDRNGREPTRINWRQMREIIRLMTKHREQRFLLVGHVSPDERPTQAKRLGLLRARAVRDLVCVRGPSRQRFRLSSAGNEQPIGEESGLSRREREEASRRVVLRIDSENSGHSQDDEDDEDADQRSAGASDGGE